MLRLFVLLSLVTIAAVQPAFAQQAVFIVRHAERADAGSGAAMMDKDPELSAEGQSRARALASLLRDANIRAIYTTELRRTEQTAAPLASALGLTVIKVPGADVATLIQKVRAETGNVLVVGHSNTIPKILSALGATESVSIADNEYDNLFIVQRDAPARLLRLRYR
jgi:broad specificity phosphatase PhoE